MDLEGDFVSERGVLLASGGSDAGAAAEGVITSKSEESGLEKALLGVDPDGTFGHSDDSSLLPARGGKKKRNRKRNKKGRRPEFAEEHTQNLETSEVQSEVTVSGSRAQSKDELLPPTTPATSPITETQSPSEASLGLPPKHLESHDGYVKQSDGYILDYDKHAKEVEEQLKVLEMGQVTPKDLSLIGHSIPCAPNPSVAEIETDEEFYDTENLSATVIEETSKPEDTDVSSELSLGAYETTLKDSDALVSYPSEVPIDKFLDAQEFVEDYDEFADVRSTPSDIPIEEFLTAQDFIEADTPTNSGTELPMDFKLTPSDMAVLGDVEVPSDIEIPIEESGVSGDSEDRIGDSVESPVPVASKVEVPLDYGIPDEFDEVDTDYESNGEAEFPISEEISDLSLAYNLSDVVLTQPLDSDNEFLAEEIPYEGHIPLGDDLDMETSDLEQESPKLHLNTKEALDEWKNKNPEGVKVLCEIIDAIINEAIARAPSTSHDEKSEDSESIEIVKEFQERTSSAVKEETDSLNNFLPVKNEDYEVVYPQEIDEIAEVPVEARKSVHDSEGFPVFQEESEEESTIVPVSEDDEACRGIYEVIQIPDQLPWTPERLASLHLWYAETSEDGTMPSASTTFDPLELTPARVASFEEWYAKKSHQLKLSKGQTGTNSVNAYLDRVPDALNIAENELISEWSEVDIPKLPDVPSDQVLTTEEEVTFGFDRSMLINEADLEEILLAESVSDPHFDVRSSSEDVSAKYWATSQDSSLTVVESRTYVPDSTQETALEDIVYSVSRTYIPEQCTQLDEHGPATMTEESRAKRASLGRRVMKGLHDIVVPIVLPCRRGNTDPEDLPEQNPSRGRGPAASVSNPTLNNAPTSRREQQQSESRGKRFGSLRRLINRNK